MEDFEMLISEILEVDSVNPEDELTSFDEWDSLTILSIIALCDEHFGVQLAADEIEDSRSINGLKELILLKQ
jgi:acyl carrier protein